MILNIKNGISQSFALSNPGCSELTLEKSELIPLAIALLLAHSDRTYAEAMDSIGKNFDPYQEN